MTTAVDVDDVSKRFRLYHQKYSSLKERVLHAGSNPYEEFWALQDVSFDVVEGETVGIVGRNGSGKSTLLKCISGILQPTKGKVVVRGQLAALLELGAGFQPELSGRENIFLNASLLGLSTREVEKRFDAIVAFAELEQFIDNQVKYYSSGMYMRLGFAVAVNVEPDVLVIDEVLAVGDENFQHKCMGRIKQFQAEGRTILFVTHAAEQVREICDRAVVLEGGQLVAVGGASEALHQYHERLAAQGAISGPEPLSDGPPALGRIRLEEPNVEHPGTGSRPYLLPGEPLSVQVPFEAIEPVNDVVFVIAIRDQQGTLIFKSDTLSSGQPFDAPLGAGRVDFSFTAIPLLQGTYDVEIAVTDRLGMVIDVKDPAVRFDVINPGRSTGAVALDMRAEIRSSILG
ncbi:MAG TPA: ABC transporter ATP-binding protein [Acidimicrobiales bacterium]|nr:ABC transporter ATP-binding protein [Acidimicrobiales bacterium]